MAKYLVDYYETYSKSYEIEADSKEEAEEKVKDGIREGLFDPPENCSDSWCETEEIKWRIYLEMEEFVYGIWK